MERNKNENTSRRNGQIFKSLKKVATEWFKCYENLKPEPNTNRMAFYGGQIELLNKILLDIAKEVKEVKERNKNES